MEKFNREDIYNIELDGKIVNAKNLYEIIVKEYSKNQNNYELNIKGENNKVILKKNLKGCYEAEIHNTKILLNEKVIEFKKDNKFFSFNIYCYKNLITILKNYNFVHPIFYRNNKKIIINMEKNDGDINSLFGTTFIEEEIPTKITNYLITKEKYQSERKEKIRPSDLENNKATVTLNMLGKYAKNYLQGINEKENLFYLENRLLNDFQSESRYFEGNKEIGLFNFLTGSEKSGKTFSLLCLNIYEFEENYRIYLNDRYMTELENDGKYDEILNTFFYEISKFFCTYEDYESFSKKFIEKIFETKNSVINFKELISKFINEIDLFIQENKEKYNKMVIIFDDFELDETNPEKFEQNNKFITDLYQKRINNPIIHFTFIAPINDNYIKKCILFALDLEKRLATTGITKKDEKRDIVYYPFTYYCSCFMDPEKDYEKYKNKIIQKNKEELNIPNNYLKTINYSLFHINNIKNECGGNLQIKEEKIKEYIKKLEEDSDKFVNNFFMRENGLYIYDIDKLKKCHKLISKDFIEYEELIEILNCLPIKLLNFYKAKKKIDEFKVEYKYKVSYLLEFYKNSISKFISSYDNVIYESDEKIKPGSKGDSLEDKVIDSIENKYFDNFKPDLTIEINNIFNLSTYDDLDEDRKIKFKDEINMFEEVFSNENFKLIMIKQKITNAKKYDLAFLQQYKKGKYQFILIQITRNKDKTDLFQYQQVNNDCYNFANFFSIFDNIEVKRYHFLFIIQGGYVKNQKPMIDFLESKGIKYIKFFIDVNKNIFFLDSQNNKIKNLIFDTKSNTIVELIQNFNKNDNVDNLSSSSEYSVLGQKRQKASKIAKAKYAFGITIYNKIKTILDCDKFELCTDNYSIKENQYFYIYYKKGENKKKIFYLVYKKEGKEIIVNINKAKHSNNQDEEVISENDLDNAKFKCFRMIKEKKELSL